jgi:exodeoxyribonuclease VII small subunit
MASPPMTPGQRASDREDDGESRTSIDEILAGLEDVVRELESGELPLERALERFEHGVRLARQGSKVLDAVEERVEMLLADGQTVPLREQEDDGQRR